MEELKREDCSLLEYRESLQRLYMYLFLQS